ncbi:MAG: hypothetical protein ACK4NY_16615 [Spirosomataceae bacterium]
MAVVATKKSKSDNLHQKLYQNKLNILKKADTIAETIEYKALIEDLKQKNK